MPRLFTLEAHWTSDERLWLRRSVNFIRSVQTGNFEQTLQAHHPGVTTPVSHPFRYRLRTCPAFKKLRPGSIAMDTAVSAFISGKAEQAFRKIPHRRDMFSQLCCAYRPYTLAGFLDPPLRPDGPLSFGAHLFAAPRLESRTKSDVARRSGIHGTHRRGCPCHTKRLACFG